MAQGVTPFEKQLHAASGRINERKSLEEGEISARLSVQGHHLVAILHSGQEGAAAFFNLWKVRAVLSATRKHKYRCQ